MTSPCTSSASSSSNGNWHVGACDLTTRFGSRLMSPYSHRVFTHLLHSCSPRVFTRLLCSRSLQAFARPLRGKCMLPTCRLVPLCANRCWALWGMFRPLVGFTIRIWRSSLFVPCLLSSSLFRLSWDFGVHILCHMHQSGFHPFHYSSDHVHISFNMCKSSCMLFCFVNSGVLGVLSLLLDLLMNQIRNSKYLLVCPCHNF